MTLILYSRADTWLARSELREADRPLHSFANLVALSVKGVGYALGTLVPKKKIQTPATVGAAGSAVAMLALFFAGAHLSARAATNPAVPPPAAVAKAGEGAFNSSFTLKDIGVPEAIQFRGVDASRGIPFGLPQNEVVEKAKLNLSYSFSPSLLSNFSHLNVLLNGTLIASLPAPSKDAASQNPVKTSLVLPADLLTRQNVLGFQFIGHYTLSCEDPSNTMLWGRVETNSSIETSGSLLGLSDDLSVLPLPFYDATVTGGGSASIPFAFVNQPSDEAIQAAGIVASWFGIQAKSKALTFPVTSDGALPKGNVVLFLEGSAAPSGIDVRHDGPVIAMRANPRDPFGKILIIAGESGAQLVTAAQSLVLGSNLLRGATSQVSDFQLPAARQADDAPLWLRTDRVSPFWNYSEDQALQSDGSGTLPVYLRIPPDLYFGDTANLPLHLDYRYNAVSLAPGSTMRVSANGALVNELPLPQRDNPRQMLNTTVAVPLVDMRPFANTFLFNFFFQIPKAGPCRNNPPINLQGALLRSSYLDLRGYSHFAAMPNLELFANAGFPFTRFADLSQTTIAIPPRASNQEVSLLMMLLAHFGEQTGYPVLRVHVDASGNLNKDMDFLVLGTSGDQPAFNQLAHHLPVSITQEGTTVQDTGSFFPALEQAWWAFAELRPGSWWKLPSSQEKAGVIASLGESPDAVIQGVESPWARSRSIVTITVKNDNAAEAFTAAFLKSRESGDIDQSVSILNPGGFASYRLGNKFYQVGSLSWWSNLRYRLREFPWLIVLLTFTLGLIVVPWTRAKLDQRQRARLASEQA